MAAVEALADPAVRSQMIARGCANAAERACVLAGTLSPGLAALRLRPSFGPTAIGSPINAGDD